MRTRGYSLLELLIGLALTAILLMLGLPGLEWLALDARRTANVNAFVTAVQLARSESAKRSRAVVLCKTDDGAHCGGAGIDFDAGWMVFVDEDQDQPPQRDPGEALLLHHLPDIEGSIRSNRAYYLFRPYFKRSTNGTVVFCDRRGAAAARAVIVSYTGRPRVAGTGASGQPLACET